MGMNSIEYFGALLAFSRFDVTTDLQTVEDRIFNYRATSGLWSDAGHLTSRFIPLLHLLWYHTKFGFGEESPPPREAYSHPLEGTVADIIPTLLHTAYGYSGDCEPPEWWEWDESELSKGSSIHALRQFFANKGALNPNATREFFYSLFAPSAPLLEEVDDPEWFVAAVKEIEVRVASYMGKQNDEPT